MAEVVTTPYSTTIPYTVGVLLSWLDEYNGQRIRSYDLYDDMYDNSPSTFALLLRGSDEKPIYVPTAKRLINTLSRYVGKGWGYVLDPTLGTPAERELLMSTLGALFRRERILSQFTSGKKEWLRRGDWCWMLLGDPLKAAGSRLNVKTIDPRTFFPILEIDVVPNGDPDRVVGQQIVEQFLLGDGTTYALKVQSWFKYTHPAHTAFGQTPGTEPFDIEYTTEIWDMATWAGKPDDRKLLSTPQPKIALEGIPQLPIYHLKNGSSTALPFGESDLKSLESLITGINQAITDEDLALAMAGHGMYYTDGGRPVDGAGNPTNWIIGPDQVVEVGKGAKFERVTGVQSVEPSLAHVGYLEEVVFGMSGVNDIALGRTKGTVESGIALAIRMQPLFDAADERDLTINDIWGNLLYDLIKYWLPAYEDLNFGEAMAYSETDTGDRLPFDRASRYAELRDGLLDGMFTLKYVLDKLKTEFGYDDIPEEMLAELTGAVEVDPEAARADAELNAPEDDETGDGDPAE